MVTQLTCSKTVKYVHSTLFVLQRAQLRLTPLTRLMAAATAVAATAATVTATAIMTVTTVVQPELITHLVA